MKRKGYPASTSEERIARLRELILVHPTYGRRRLAKELRQEFGVGLRMTTIQRVHDLTVTYTKPPGKKTVASLIAEQMPPEEFLQKGPTAVAAAGFDYAYHRMASAGWLRFEIQEAFSATAPYNLFRSPGFEQMMKDRRAWIRGQMKRGWSKERVIAEIRNFYYERDAFGQAHRRKHRSPFDFLRDSYGRLLQGTPAPQKIDRAIDKRVSTRQASEREANIRKGVKARKITKKLYSRGGPR